MTELELRALAEMVAEVLVERGILAKGMCRSGRVLDAAAVAQLLGRERQWVYDHANELGAFRYGDGPRARLGFDAQEVERWMRERRRQDREPAPSRRRIAPEVGDRLIPYEGSGRGA
jgi:predicted DNA-binding transcriptional regulator AlpA